MSPLNPSAKILDAYDLETLSFFDSKKNLLGVLTLRNGSQHLVTIPRKNVTYWTRFQSIFNYGPLAESFRIGNKNLCGDVQVKLKAVKKYFKGVEIKSLESSTQKTVYELAGKWLMVQKKKIPQFWKRASEGPYKIGGRKMWINSACKVKHVKKMFFLGGKYKSNEKKGKYQEVRTEDIVVRRIFTLQDEYINPKIRAYTIDESNHGEESGLGDDYLIMGDDYLIMEGPASIDWSTRYVIELPDFGILS